MVPDPEGKPKAWNDEGDMLMSPQVFSFVDQLEPRCAFLLDVGGREIVVAVNSRMEGWRYSERFECLLSVKFHSIESCQIHSQPS
jgi:hypothetical protein